MKYALKILLIATAILASAYYFWIVFIQTYFILSGSDEMLIYKHRAFMALVFYLGGLAMILVAGLRRKMSFFAVIGILIHAIGFYWSLRSIGNNWNIFDKDVILAYLIPFLCLAVIYISIRAAYLIKCKRSIGGH